MKILNLFIVSIVLLLLMPVKILAQKQVVKGRVVLCNALQQTEALPYANIALIQLPDSTFVTGAVSDEQGKFTCSFSHKKNHSYLFKVSYTGCSPVFKTITSQSDTVRLGTIKLKENALHLKEIVVVAPLKAMEQKGDTTIYNVDAYPTPEGSYLQELVKRIPGLTYDPKEKPSLTTDIPSKK